MNRILTILLSTMVMASSFAGTVAKKSEKDSAAGSKAQKTQSNKKKNTKQSKAETMKTQRIYIYGVAVSPSDSVVYMTDELLLDSAVMYNKSRFLYGRSMLSKQFHDHLVQEGNGRCISSVTYAGSIKKLDKRYTKQVMKLKKRGYLIKNVGQTTFRFNNVKP